jgi:cytochrome c oxidase subunit IV
MSIPVPSDKGGAAQYSDSLTKYFVVYGVILIIAALQFMVAYTHADGSQIFLRMLSLAIVEGGLAVMFFMHLGSERRAFVWFVGVFTLFVLAALQYSWTDSYRMEMGVPNANYKTGTVQ